MRPDETEIQVNERGDEVHPSFATIQLSKVTAHPGVALFDSSIRHSEYIAMRVYPATRKRDLHHDYIHSTHQPYIEVEMSLSQWGHLVSSFGNGSGTPVTLAYFGGERVPRAKDDESRLAVTAREVKEAAQKSTEQVKAAVAEVVGAFEAKADRVEMGKKISWLSSVLGNLPANMKFAADTLTKHSENVVAKAQADIEAMHLRAARVAHYQLAEETTAAPKEIETR